MRIEFILPSNSNPAPEKGFNRTKRALRICFIVLGILSALWMEIQGHWLCSTVPDFGLGRTVQTMGLRGDVVYVSPAVNLLSWIVWGIAMAALVAWGIWPAKDRK
jgi:hypothetical protein